jgi:hypothetical protein
MKQMNSLFLSMHSLHPIVTYRWHFFESLIYTTLNKASYSVSVSNSPFVIRAVLKGDAVD